MPCTDALYRRSLAHVASSAVSPRVCCRLPVLCVFRILRVMTTFCRQYELSPSSYASYTSYLSIILSHHIHHIHHILFLAFSFLQFSSISVDAREAYPEGKKRDIRMSKKRWRGCRKITNKEEKVWSAKKDFSHCIIHLFIVLHCFMLYWYLVYSHNLLFI